MVDENVKQELLELAQGLGVSDEIGTLLGEEPSSEDDPFRGMFSQEQIKRELPDWAKKLKAIESKPISGQYRIPAEGGLVSRHHPGVATKTHAKGHFGWDIGNSLGTPIYSIGPGEVIAVTNEGNNPKGGNAVKISHENGNVISYYAHLDQVNVRVGEQVNQNSQIGTMGTSGMIYNGVKRNTKPHLHFQVKVNGTDIDPSKLRGAEIGSLSKGAAEASRLTKVAEELNIILCQTALKPLV